MTWLVALPTCTLGRILTQTPTKPQFVKLRDHANFTVSTPVEAIMTLVGRLAGFNRGDEPTPWKRLPTPGGTFPLPGGLSAFEHSLIYTPHTNR